MNDVEITMQKQNDALKQQADLGASYLEAVLANIECFQKLGNVRL